MTFITSTMLQDFMDKHVEDDDSKPDGYCNSAMEMIRDYLGYDPEKQSYKQTLRGDNGRVAVLCAMPICAITAFSVDDIEHDVAEIEVEKENYIRFADDFVFRKGSRYVITFTAGYDPVPEIIKTTALQIASLFWESAGGNLAVSSTSFADTGSRVFNNFTADRFLKQIAHYKRVY